MSEPKGFFGNIFESSEEDPLLQSDPTSDNDEASRNAASSDASSADASSSGEATHGLFSGSGDAHDTESDSARASDARNGASWDERDRSDTRAGDASPEDDETRRVTVTESHDPWADRLTWEGLDTLNDAVQTGWHVVDIDAKRQASDDTRLTLEFILERDIPRSLFDFGPSW